MNDLKSLFVVFVEHLYKQNILSPGNIDFDSSIVDIATSTKEELLKVYPDTALREPVKSLHYAGTWDDGGLKNTAFLLDYISQLLYFNNHLDQNKVMEFFQSKTQDPNFDFSPINLVKTTIEGLCLAEK